MQDSPRHTPPAASPASDIAQAFTPLTLGPLRLHNRFIKAATNEGRAKCGVVSKGLAQFHAQIAQGGAALTTVAYCAPSKDGRTFVDQAVLDEESLPDFRALTEAVHRHGGAASAQITHAGSFTFLDKQTLRTQRPWSSSGGFNKVGVMSGRYLKKAMNRAAMDAISAEFTAAAIRAREAGFDAVEIHMGHGYLLSQFISKIYNKRRDDYGGAIAQRMRFPSKVLRRVLDAVGKDLAVLVKISMTDGLRGNQGNQIADGIVIAKAIERDGAHMAILSNGLNIESITAMFGSPFPKANRGKAPNRIIALGMWLQSLTAPADVIFRENYLRDLAVQIRGAVDIPLGFLGGVQSRAGVAHAMADGFEAVVLGRALLFDPRFVAQLESGKVETSGCTACNHCVTTMYTSGGTRCVLTSDSADNPNNPNNPNNLEPILNKQRASAGIGVEESENE